MQQRSSTNCLSEIKFCNMKKFTKPSSHEIWFIKRIRKDNALNELNKRQKRILEKVRKWEKFQCPIEQKEWKFLNSYDNVT